MNIFKLESEYKPQGDQPKAILSLINSLKDGVNSQTLLGVTGSGKTFTMANVIEQNNKPTLVISHNKTLAAQLYSELKQFFPYNKVEYFVSYYDYYQPEAYLPASGKYIEKDLLINKELERLRLSAIASLLSERNDVIIVSSVSCIYGLNDPEQFKSSSVHLRVGECISFDDILLSFVNILYSRSIGNFTRGTFRVNGDVVDIFLAYDNFAYRFFIFDNTIEEIQKIDPVSGLSLGSETNVIIFPANLFVTNKDTLEQIIDNIESDLDKQINYFINNNLNEEANRIKQRTELDISMIREIGYCSGIENYSRYFDQRKEGERPFCLLDYFPKDYLIFIDESHVTIPQIRAMWGGDKARKENLVNNGFRLPSALDNRPLNFNEFKSLINNVIYISATPSDYELLDSNGVIVEQIIRPTGLLDPKIEVKPSLNQIDDLVKHIHERVNSKERVLITTLTKRMAEELATYLTNINIKCQYIHSEIKTLDRIEIINKLKSGELDVLIGVNLLREGLDLPEVSLVIILDADKEGFLRNTKSLIQTIGRAARNVNGKVIMYADYITESMDIAIKETDRRRFIQSDYNLKNNIIPKSVNNNNFKKEVSLRKYNNTLEGLNNNELSYLDINNDIDMVADYSSNYGFDKMSKLELKNLIDKTKNKMLNASKKQDFINAAQQRDLLLKLEGIFSNKN